MVYKIDKDYKLMDENDYYIMNSVGEHIKLSLGQVALLRDNGVFV